RCRTAQSRTGRRGRGHLLFFACLLLMRRLLHLLRAVVVDFVCCRARPLVAVLSFLAWLSVVVSVRGVNSCSFGRPGHPLFVRCLALVSISGTLASRSPAAGPLVALLPFRAAVHSLSMPAGWLLRSMMDL